MYTSVRPIMYCMEPCLEIFQSVQNNNRIKKINLYVDVKNSSTNLFIPDAVEDIIETGKRLNSKIESSIFQSIIVTAANWKNAARQFGLECEIFFCNDKGGSKYHKGINPKYKANRKITNVLMEHYKEDLDATKLKNWGLAEKVCNKIDNVHFFNLNFLESDFIPYYIIKKHYSDRNDVLHVLSSNDKDHYQVLNLPNTCMFSRKSGTTTILDKQSYLSKYIKINSLEQKKQSEWIQVLNKINLEYINVIMAFCGDVSDNIKGLHKIGEKTAVKMLAEDVSEKLLGTPEELLNRVNSGGNLIIDNAVPLSHLSKNWVFAIQNNQVVTDSYKQISYDCLIHWMELQDNLNKIENVKILEENINKPLANSEALNESLINHINKLEDCVLTEEHYYSLFN